MGELAAFLAVSALVIVTPGQDTALTIRSVLRGGRRAGIATAWGVGLGQVAWTVATSAGITALLLASEVAFLVLKLGGAAYLVYLGTAALAAAFRGRAPEPDVPSPVRALAPSTAFRQGLVSNLANPKMAAFFTGLLPQFAPGRPTFAALLALGCVFACMTVAWLCAYAAVVEWAGDLLRRERVRRAIEGVTGCVLVGLGVRVATMGRSP